MVLTVQLMQRLGHKNPAGNVMYICKMVLAGWEKNVMMVLYLIINLSPFHCPGRVKGSVWLCA